MKKDPIVESVRSKLWLRSQFGIKKYGTDMTRTDLTELDWLRHAQEEALDLAVYLERLIQDKENLKPSDTPKSWTATGPGPTVTFSNEGPVKVPPGTAFL